jgi:hypothetical protein
MSDQPSSKLDLERVKIELEHEKIKLERNKAIWTSLSIFIPLLIAALTIAFNSWSQVQQTKSDFILQAAEIVMSSETPTGSYNRARALAALFPEQLPSNFQSFAEAFNPEKYAAPSTTAQKTLLEWLILYPEQREDILDAWIILFPEDEWVNDLR